MLRAIRAGGELETIEKLLERASAIGETLGTTHPFFAYSQHTFETGRDLPLISGTIMAIAQAVGRTERRFRSVRDADPTSRRSAHPPRPARARRIRS